MLYEFIYTDTEGNHIDLPPSEGVVIRYGEGFKASITIRGRRSDGRIEIYCDGQLVVHPRATNLAYVHVEK